MILFAWRMPLPEHYNSPMHFNKDQAKRNLVMLFRDFLGCNLQARERLSADTSVRP